MDYDRLKEIIEKLLKELNIDEKYLELVARGILEEDKISKDTAEELLYALHPIRLIKRFWPLSYIG